MKKNITAAVLLLATALSAFSQTKNITVSGRVLEDTNEPAVQATFNCYRCRTALMQPVLPLRETATLPCRR